MSEAKRSSRLLRFAPFVVLAGLLLHVVARLPPAEPRYGGKPLHYWLARMPALEVGRSTSGWIGSDMFWSNIRVYGYPLLRMNQYNQKDDLIVP
jgi:hypothetical protein